MVVVFKYQARGWNPALTSGTTGLLLATFGAACATDETPESITQAVVYDQDDRQEVLEHHSSLLASVAKSAVAVKVRTSRIEDTDGFIEIDSDETLGEAKNLCDGERFRDQPEPGTCSGVLIDSRYMLTAGHCMDELDDCNGDRSWVLGYRYQAGGELAQLTRADVYTCRRVVAFQDDEDADFAVFELDREVTDRIPAAVETAPMMLGEPLALIGHPNGIPMKLDSGGVLTSIGEPWLKATVDAFDGNSGSGVFDHQGRVRAILTNGQDDYVERGDCQVVNIIRSPISHAETLFPVGPVMEAFCDAPGADSDLCECDGPCVPYQPADTCETAETIEAIDQEIRDSLVLYAPAELGSCGGRGPDRAYQFELPANARLTATVDGFDTVLYLRRACGREVACSDDRSDSDRSSRIDTALVAGNYTLVVDAFNENVSAFTLNLQFRTASPAMPDAGVAEDAMAPDANTDAPLRDGGCTASSQSRPWPSWLLLAWLAIGYRRASRRAK